MSHVMRKPVYAICEQQRRRSACASAQSDQRLCYSLPRWYNTFSFYIQNFKPLASLCSWAGRFESYLVANPEDRFSHDVARMTSWPLLRCLCLRFKYTTKFSLPKIACPAIVYAEIVVVIDVFFVGVCPWIKVYRYNPREICQQRLQGVRNVAQKLCSWERSFIIKSLLTSWFGDILSKNKKYPGNSLSEQWWKYIAVQCMYSNIDHLAMSHMAVHFGFMCKCWNKECFKHKKGSFLFSQIKTLKTAEFKHTKKCFILKEIAKRALEI